MMLKEFISSFSDSSSFDDSFDSSIIIFSEFILSFFVFPIFNFSFEIIASTNFFTFNFSLPLSLLFIIFCALSTLFKIISISAFEISSKLIVSISSSNFSSSIDFE